MNALQTKKLCKYRAVHALLHSATETSAIAMLPPRIALLGAKLAEIDVLALCQSQPTRDHIARRDAHLREMIDATLVVSGLVRCYAAEHRLPDLDAQARVRPSDFKRTRLIQRPMLAQRVLDAATPLVPELATVGVTAAMLSDLHAKIAAADAALTEPRRQICERKAATARLAELFQDIEALLRRQIDRLLYPLLRTHPESYIAYLRTRATRGRWRVLHLAATRAKPSVAPRPAVSSPIAKLHLVATPPAPIPLALIAAAPPAAEARVA